MATSNSGKQLDTSGNVQVDFVWGNMPRQPNDVRSSLTNLLVPAVGDNPVNNVTLGNPNYSLQAVTDANYRNNRLVPAIDGHDALLGGWAGYPSFSAGNKDINNQYQGDPGKFGITIPATSVATTASQTVSGASTIVVASNAGIAVGQTVTSSSNITAGTTVTSISGRVIGLSAPTLQSMPTSPASTTATQVTVNSVVNYYSITVSSATGISVGQDVFSAGYIAPGTTVTSVSGTTIGLSQPVIQALSSTAIKFATGVAVTFGASNVASTTATQSTVGSYNIVVASAAGIAVGQGVASSGYIPAGAVVTSVVGTTIGISEATTAAMSSTAVVFGPDGAWTYTPYLVVPSVMGLSTANAQDGLRDAGYPNANITTASGTGNNSSKTVSAIARTAGSNVATITATGHGYTVSASGGDGAQVTISALTSPNTEFNGTWAIKNVTTNTFDIVSANTTVVSQTGLSGAVIGVQGTIKTQNVLPGAAGIDGSAAITITPFG
jgi:hypothetical protein